MRSFTKDHMKYHVKMACPAPAKSLYLQGRIIFNNWIPLEIAMQFIFVKSSHTVIGGIVYYDNQM